MKPRALGLTPAASLSIAVIAAALAALLSLTEAGAATRPHPPAGNVVASNVIPAPVPFEHPGPADPRVPDPTPPAPLRPVPSAGLLSADIQALAARSNATVGVTLIQLGKGGGPQTVSVGGDRQFTAASTYKLPLLMAEAEGIAAGRLGPGDVICYQGQDWEDGWYDDYVDGSCYTRQVLAGRVAQNSDNTAGHMLVRELGGTDALNAFARRHGARASAFYDPNTTDPDDLAALWADEAAGRMGGAKAQAWLYPLLTHTSFEAGIPAGSGKKAVVVHKIGELDATVNDAALVQGGPTGAYILVVCTEGPGGDAGYALISAIASRVAAYQAAR